MQKAICRKLGGRDMKVKELKRRISLLRDVYSNALKIQECCLRNENAKECIKTLEEKTQINTSLRSFASSTASYISDEIKRLEDIIDNADVKID